MRVHTPETANDVIAPIPETGTRRLASVAQLRLGLIMEEVVGHAVQASYLRQYMAAKSDVESRYVPITYRERGTRLESMRLLPSYLRAAYIARCEVAAGLKGARPDALLWNTQLPAMLCPDRLARTPSIISTDVTPLQYDALGDLYNHAPDPRGIEASVKRLAVTRTFRMARHVVPWTEWAARSIIDDYGVDPAKVTVIPPGTDLQRFHPSRIKPSSLDGRIRLLFVGGDFERKGGPELLQWFRASRAANGRAELHLVTGASVVAENVVVHRLSHDDPRLAQLYGESDIFVLPTRAECFGIALTEALAASLPCVTCAVGGVGEIVEDGVNGFHVAPGEVGELGEAIETLIDDEDLRLRYGEQGRVIAEARFDYQTNSGRLLELLRSIAR